MNRKSSLVLKNKKIQMAVSLIQKFVLVLALSVMMVVTAHAGAFLAENDGTTTDPGDTYSVSNNNRGDLDNWIAAAGGYKANDDAYTGYYIGTFPGNNLYESNNKTDLQDLITDFLNPEPFTFLGHDKDDGIGENLVVTLPLNNDDSGTWEVVKSADNTTETIDFYSVKGGNYFALYYVNPDASSGKWITGHLPENTNNISPTISHFSVVKTSELPEINNPIPEPATMLLFGFSLIGLAGVARRKNSKF